MHQSLMAFRFFSELRVTGSRQTHVAFWMSPKEQTTSRNSILSLFSIVAAFHFLMTSNADVYMAPLSHKYVHGAADKDHALAVVADERFELLRRESGVVARNEAQFDLDCTELEYATCAR